MYYIMLVIAVFIFAENFAIDDIYANKYGNSLLFNVRFRLVSSLAGLAILLVINGFKIEFTYFSLLMAFVTAIINIWAGFFAFKALASINLSVYSLFSNMGGMMLPFFLGIFFYGEQMTLAKIVCFIFIAVSLLLTVKPGRGSGNMIYYIGIFVLNGMNGVMSKIFTEAPFDKTSAAGYSILIALCTFVVSGALYIAISRKQHNAVKFTLGSDLLGVISGSTNRVANFLLLVALAHVDASAQYPLITGGTLILTTLINFCQKNKPDFKDVLAVIAAFAGTVALFVI